MSPPYGPSGWYELSDTGDTLRTGYLLAIPFFLIYAVIREQEREAVRKYNSDAGGDEEASEAEIREGKHRVVAGDAQLATENVGGVVHGGRDDGRDDATWAEERWVIRVGWRARLIRGGVAKRTRFLLRTWSSHGPDPFRTAPDALTAECDKVWAAVAAGTPRERLPALWGSAAQSLCGCLDLSALS